MQSVTFFFDKCHLLFKKERNYKFIYNTITNQHLITKYEIQYENRVTYIFVLFAFVAQKKKKNLFAFKKENLKDPVRVMRGAPLTNHTRPQHQRGW